MRTNTTTYAVLRQCSTTQRNEAMLDNAAQCMLDPEAMLDNAVNAMHEAQAMHAHKHDNLCRPEAMLDNAMHEHKHEQQQQQRIATQRSATHATTTDKLLCVSVSFRFHMLVQMHKA